MPDRETIEENRILRKQKEKKEERKKERRKRYLKLGIICAVYSIVLLLGSAYVVLHLISDKKSLRQSGIDAYNNGFYVEAEKYFTDSINCNQWFSDEMDDDSRLYLASCYMRTHEYSKARDIYVALYDSRYVDQDYLDYGNSLSVALENTEDGNVDESTISTLEDEQKNGNMSVTLYLGTCYQLKGRYDDMIASYNKYIEEYGINSYIAYQLSSYYLDIDENETALYYINQGFNCKDDLYLDLIRYNDVVYSEKYLDYGKAFEKISSLCDDYPGNETFTEEYNFLYSRVNVDTVPVHTKDED